MKPKSSPDHAVLAEPWTYTLEELRYAAPEDYADSFIELTLRRVRICVGCASANRNRLKSMLDLMRAAI